MDIEELKRLADAATPGPWVVKDELSGTVYAGDIPIAATIRHSPKLNTISQIQKIANTLYLSAANPSAILELIEENKHLKELLDDDAFRKMRDDRDLLKQQRDELLAALKALDRGCRDPHCIGVLHGLDLARVAIAKAEG